MYFRLFILSLLFALAGCKNAKMASGKESALSENDRLNFTGTFIDANRDKMLGRNSEALNGFAHCIKIDPTCATCYYEIAGIMQAQRQIKLAVPYAKKAVEMDGQNKWFLALYAELTHSLRQYDECANTYNKLIKLQPSSIENYFELAEVYLEANKIDKAIETYNRAEVKTGITEEMSVQKYKLYAKTNNSEKAIIELQKLISAQPKNTKTILMLGDYMQLLGRDVEAIALYENAAKIDPSEPGTQLSLADYYFKKGDKEKAFQHLQNAFENPSLSIDSKIQMLLNYYKSSKGDSVLTVKVFQLLEGLQQAHPNDAKSYAIYGDFYYRDNMNAQALEKFRKARDLEPDKYLVWRNILAIDAENKDFQKLFDEATLAIDYFPSQAELYWYKGIAAVQLKKTTEAIEALSDGANLVAGNKVMKAQFYSTLGDLYNETKDFNKSDEYFDKALEYDANNVYVLNNYAYYLSLRKEKLSKAADMSKRSNQLSPDNASFEDTYGWILFQEEKYSDALLWLLKAENHGGGESGTILEHIGDAYIQGGDKTKALLYWNKAKTAGSGASDMIDRKITQQKYFE